MIRFLIMDVDGTLTDGKIYMGNDGEMFKAFDVKDGYAIKEILPKLSVIPIIITARESQILTNRCRELDIKELHQGVRGKLERLLSIIDRYNKDNSEHYSLKDCAYIGDDILDLQCILPIAEAGGITGCPSDAVSDVKSRAVYVSSKKGGEGAVRDFVEYLIEGFYKK